MTGKNKKLRSPANSDFGSKEVVSAINSASGFDGGVGGDIEGDGGGWVEESVHETRLQSRDRSDHIVDNRQNNSKMIDSNPDDASSEDLHDAGVISGELGGSSDGTAGKRLKVKKVSEKKTIRKDLNEKEVKTQKGKRITPPFLKNAIPANLEGRAVEPLSSPTFTSPSAPTSTPGSIEGLENSLEPKSEATLQNPFPTFRELGITYPELTNILKQEWKITEPTLIQKIAIPAILKGTDVFVADQTGTGKTLAYVLPMLQRLKEMEKYPGYRLRGQHSRAIILVPTRELVEQTTKVIKKCIECKDFNHFRVYGMAGGLTKEKKDFPTLNRGLDILVSTTDRFTQHLDKKHVTMEDTVIVVLDEADTLFSVETYKMPLMHIVFVNRTIGRVFTPLKGLVAPQHLWVTATVSKGLASYIKTEFPDAVEAFSSNIHKSVAGLRQDFLFGAGGKWQERLIMDTLKKHKGLRTMIFCNTLEKCKYLFNILEKAGYKVTMLTSDLNTKRRSESYNKFDSGDYTIMVTTDIASRGLDIQSVVEHVVLYEFPRTAIDYLHRIGRTARAGNSGLVTSFCSSRDQTLVNFIREAYANNTSLAEAEPTPNLVKSRRPRPSILSNRIPKFRDDRNERKQNSESKSYASPVGNVIPSVRKKFDAYGKTRKGTTSAKLTKTRKTSKFPTTRTKKPKFTGKITPTLVKKSSSHHTGSKPTL
eukprot:TRINITY_DN8601_c0_g1_i3.p1 TRINITY_DN8601_c0_g1~~TRINITY_DN8601_c0_g1_i3.p1  ORF type:complete len:706 (+),score=115.31 TRINITY_DN8601_c0_g1_i3:163-2280(+)